MPLWWALAAGLYWPKWLNKPNCYDPSRKPFTSKYADAVASDAEMLWSLIAFSGSPVMVPCLIWMPCGANPAGQVLLGLSEAPSGRRLGEYLSRFGQDEVTALRGVVQALAQQVAPAIIDHHVTTQGYVPVFIDGTCD